MLLEKPTSTRLVNALTDAPRVIALVSAIVSGFFYPVGSPIVFGLLVLILLAARAARLAWPFDLALGVLLLTAMWAAVDDWYTALPWLDWVLHGFATGAVAAAFRLLLIHPGVMHDVNDRDVPRYGLLITTVCIGATSAVFWEFYEWFAGAVGLPKPHTSYLDTIADMGMGTLGSLLAAFALLAWGESGRSGHRERAPEPTRAPR